MQSLWYLISSVFKTYDQTYFLIVKLLILHIFVYRRRITPSDSRDKASKYLDLSTNKALPRTAEHAWVSLQSNIRTADFKISKAAFFFFFNKSGLSLSALFLLRGRKEHEVLWSFPWQLLVPISSAGAELAGSEGQALCSQVYFQSQTLNLTLLGHLFCYDPKLKNG